MKFLKKLFEPEVEPIVITKVISVPVPPIGEWKTKKCSNCGEKNEYFSGKGRLPKKDKIYYYKEFYNVLCSYCENLIDMVFMFKSTTTSTTSTTTMAYSREAIYRKRKKKKR